ncbi:MAG: hypothetical protein R2688_05620 [Fimbriimonadaceae bacterium]
MSRITSAPSTKVDGRTPEGSEIDPDEWEPEEVSEKPGEAYKADGFTPESWKRLSGMCYAGLDKSGEVYRSRWLDG